MERFGKPIFLLAFFAILVQGLVFFNDKPDELLAIPLLLVLGGAASFFLRKGYYREDADFQVNIFLIAFSLRVLTGMIVYGWELSVVVGDEDASGYILGWKAASNWYVNGFDGFASDLAIVFFGKSNIGQSIIWGIPMYIAGGPSRLIVSVINSFAGSLLVIAIYRIARRIFGMDTAKIAAVMVTFWASIILLSASTSKEMLVILFEWTLLFLAIRNPKGLTVNDGLLSIPLFLGVFITRFYALYMVVAAYLIRIFISRRQHLVRNFLLGAAVSGAVMAFLGAGGVITRDFENLERRNTQVDAWRENVAQSTGTGVDIYSEMDNTSVAIPVATVYFFLAPFPWDIFGGTLRNSFAAVENILIMVILIIGFPALKIVFKDKLFEMAPIFVFCVLYAGLHIWGLSNVGLAWRHKQTVMPLFFILAAVGITQRRAGWNIIKSRLSRRRKEVVSVVPASWGRQV